MSEAEKAIGRTLAEAVRPNSYCGRSKILLGFAEGAAAMATELGPWYLHPTLLYPILPRTPHLHNPKLIFVREYSSFQKGR